MSLACYLKGWSWFRK